MISESDIARVMGRVQIEDVIEEKLTKAGANFKCCCPFHQEKTPSFIVFPSTNTYKCFGCGKQGNAINYLMERFGYTYPETIHRLADKYHVTIAEEVKTEMTAQQREEQEKRELMITAYQKVQQLYVSNLRQNSLEARTALEYAESRWGAEFLDQMGIGYAYNSYDHLRKFAKEQHISEAILIELGLLKHNEEKDSTYDFFRGRIMIPIRSSSHLLIGYTSRLVDSLAKPTTSGEMPAKYINSPNSLLYTKDQSIFGIDRAQRKGAADDMFYMVEGGPDVLRLQIIGIENAVASLGSDWTTNQLEKLKRIAHNVCLIPDIDVPKSGEDFGTGIRKVMKTGEACLKMGFDSVLVKEIVTGQAKDDKTKKYKVEKADADSYFKNRTLFDATKEMPFIVWYAAKLNCAHPDNTTENIGTLARLLCYVQEEYKVNILIAQIGTYISATQKIWTEALKNAKREASKESLKAGKRNTLDGDMLDKYGFQEKDNCYVAVGEKGKAYAWSNFILKPLFHIKDITSSSRLFRIINEDNHEEIIELSQDDLVSRTQFMKKIESLGNFIFIGKDEQLTSLKRYLYKVTNTAYLIRQMGWQRAGFFAFGNGVFDGQSFIPTNEYGIVSIHQGTPEQRNYYLPSASKIYEADTTIFQFERRFVMHRYGEFSLYEFVQQMVVCFGDNAKVGVAFLFATLFRDIVISYTKMFPILNVFGVKGTGKSELGHTLMSFFIINNIPANIQNSTMAALAEVVAQCSNALVHIDEYKNTIDINKIEFLKGLWDGTGRSRMNMDKDKKREITQVDAGVILTGQEIPNKDNALFSRLIFLKTMVAGEERTQTERNQFQHLVDMRKLGCSHLTLEILKYRAQFEAKFMTSQAIAYEDLKNALNDTPVEERLLNNWLVPLAAFHALRTCIKMPFTYEDLLKVSAQLLIEQNDQTKDGSELASFWNIVDFLYKEGLLKEDGDYRFEWVRCLRVVEKRKQIKTISFDKPKLILFLRHRRLLELYQMHGKKTGEELISKKTINYYLTSDTSIYYGLSTTKRYKVYLNGQLQTETISTKKNGTEEFKTVERTTTDQAYCFDYEVVQDMYGINLQSSLHIETGSDDHEPEPPEPEQGSLSFGDEEDTPTQEDWNV